MPITAQGQTYAFGSSGFGTQDRLTRSGMDMMGGGFYADSGATDVAGAGATAAPTTNLTAYLIGAFVLLVVLKYATEHEKSHMAVELVGINVWNWISVGLMATLFIVSFKAILNKYPVKGLTQLVNVA